MSQRRQQHAASVFPDGAMLVTGGTDWNCHDLDTSEIYSPSQGLFLPGPTLPFTMAGHCQVTWFNLVTSNKVQDALFLV